MSFDQFTHLLAVLAWPIVALIAGVAAVHCCRLLTEVLADESERWRKSNFELALLVEERRSRTQSHIEQERIILERDRMSFDDPHRHPRQLTPEMRRQAVGKAAETALMTLLAANGGFPGAANDDAVRQIVREVRKLHEEVDKPTPEPVGAKEKVRAPNAGTDPDDLTLDEIFGRPAPDLEEDMEEMEL